MRSGKMFRKGEKYGYDELPGVRTEYQYEGGDLSALRISFAGGRAVPHAPEAHRPVLDGAL